MAQQISRLLFGLLLPRGLEQRFGAEAMKRGLVLRDDPERKRKGFVLYEGGKLAFEEFCEFLATYEDDNKDFETTRTLTVSVFRVANYLSGGDNTRTLLDGSIKPGEMASSFIDGRPKRWSWGCADCGLWDDGYPKRDDARRAYNSHREGCLVHTAMTAPDPYEGER